MQTHHDPFRTYCLTFGSLLLLLAVTVGVAFLPLGAWNSAIAVTVATVKAVLILLFFMHLYHSDKLTWIFALAGVAWLALLLVTVLTDYASRDNVLRS